MPVPGPGDRSKTLDVELTLPIPTVRDLDAYASVTALVRVRAQPVGLVTVPVRNGTVAATELAAEIVEQLHRRIAVALVEQGLLVPTGPTHPDDLDPGGPWPATPAGTSVTVAVCTRDRPDDLEICLAAIAQLEGPPLEVIVVDNAPSSDAAERVVAAHPQVRYVREPRPGLDWARNRAVLEARGDVVAFTDDDAVVDGGWVHALGAVFADEPDVMAVTGLVVAAELETEAQRLFEENGGFGRGFAKRWVRVDVEGGEAAGPIAGGAGIFGTGANMAFRRSVFADVGLFDPALDVGTVTNGGGDLEMFFRVLAAGHVLVYEPAAVIRHRHRRDMEALRTQLTNNGIAVTSYLLRSGGAHPEARRDLACIVLAWLVRHHGRRLLASLVRPAGFPRSLVAAELTGTVRGLPRYRRARRTAAAIERQHGPQPELAPLVVRPRPTVPPGGHRDPGPLVVSARPIVPPGGHGDPGSLGVRPRPTVPPGGHGDPGSTAVRVVDLGEPLAALTGLEQHHAVRVFVVFDGTPLGHVDVGCRRRDVSVARLAAAIADGLHHQVIRRWPGRVVTSWEWDRALAERWVRPADPRLAEVRLPDDVAVSVVVATLDRPDDLRHCLTSLAKQETSRPVQVVVVDNNPSSGLTPPVVADFDAVTLVAEPRRGLSYARNAGFVASTGEILCSTDDDVTVPADWIERLVAPFARPDVGAVTGNVLPASLETGSQRLFEAYGGLGRGYEPKVYTNRWFTGSRRAVPTWTIGATANAAFRRSALASPQVGLLDEVLGPGTPTGVGEDTYLFYRLLKARWSIAYEPSALVWHTHRRTLDELRRQLRGYSTGHVAYHLTTLLQDGDLRALAYLGVAFPRWRLRQVLRWAARRSDYPGSLLALEIRSNLAGPRALVRSRRRVRVDGRSRPLVDRDLTTPDGAS